MIRRYSALTEFMKRNLITPAIDFIYSPICFHCQQPVASGEYLCESCESWLIKIDYESEQHISLRNEVRAHCKNVHDIYALFDFQPGGVLQTLIHDLKYQQKTNIGVDMGRELGRAVNEYFGVDESWILYPVPLHPVKERERGYNQSYYIARGVQEITGATIDKESIRRSRKTRTQTKLSTTERKANVTGAFTWHNKKEMIDGRSVAIIDDVITTGVTVGEIADIIPGKVTKYAFSLGHSPLLT